MKAKLHVCIPSSGRPHNVSMMEERWFRKWKVEPTWYIHRDEQFDYHVSRMSIPGGVKDKYTLTKTRNIMIHEAQIQGAWCVQVDDDLRNLQEYAGEGTSLGGVWMPTTLKKTVGDIITAMKKTGAKLGGLSPTDNKMFARNAYDRQGRYRENGYICSLMVIAPDCELRFDENLATKEDYDFCLQNVKEYGKLIRMNHIIQSFSHYTQKGGFGPIRNDEVEQQSVDYLQEKWGDCIGTNKKRQGVEIRIAKWPSS